jgi:hypothetical protein
MNLENVLLSVGRTWRYDVGGRTAVDLTKNRYAREINRLKGTNEPTDFQLPWPPYQSMFWRYMLSAAYREIATPHLVDILVPLRRWQFLVEQGVPGTQPRIEVEAIRHPFALTTIAHFRLRPQNPWPSGADAAALLNRLTRGNVGVMTPVDGGFPYRELPTLPSTDASGADLSFSSAGRFTVVSALHRETDPLVPAAALARRFPATPTPAGSVAIRDGAVNVQGDTVGLAITAQVGARTAGCLHHNYTMLLAYLQNLAALVVTAPTVEAQWFRERAVWMLNHLHRAVPAPPVYSVYRSRLAQLWLDERGLAEPIDELAGELGLGLPKLNPTT